MSAESTPDAAWLAGIRAGDDAVFDQVVGRHQRPLFAFAWRYLQNSADAEELVIETFVRLHQARARLRADTNLPAWLFTTLANLCHNRHRWRTRHREVSLDAPPDGPDGTLPAPAEENTLEHDEAHSALRAAVDHLPHDQRTVVLLHHYQQLSYREISDIVHCSERGVETRLYRARQQLRDELATFFHEPIAS